MTPDALRSLLRTVLANPSSQDVNLLVRHAYQQALVRVRQLHHSGRLHLQQHAISLESIAFDCIAELFARDDDDAFVELHDGFAGPWKIETLDDLQVASRFRSLVFTHLHQGLIRTYKEFDPVFSKILRNIRLALRSMPGVHVYERLGMRYVSPVEQANRLDERPDLHFHALQQLASTVPPATHTTKAFLISMLGAIASQEEYRRACAIFDLTLLLKHHVARERVPLGSIAIEDHSILGLDVTSIVREQMEIVRKRFHEEYVAGGKMTPEEFGQYQGALADLINDQYIFNNGQDQAQPDYLIAHMPGLTRDEYRQRHRAYFEYMVKVARRTVGATLQDLFG